MISPSAAGHLRNPGVEQPAAEANVLLDQLFHYRRDAFCGEWFPTSHDLLLPSLQVRIATEMPGRAA
jgi:hypothetical protein